jgi:hypothetical protein
LKKGSNELMLAVNDPRAIARLLRATGRFQFADPMAKLARIEDAQRLEAELSKILDYADPEHPILLQLKQARTTGNY